MRYFTLLILCFSLGLPAFGQELAVQPPSREIGLRFFGVGDFDFIYKKAKGENKFARYRLGFADFWFSDEGNNSFRGDLGLALGTERRRPVADRLWFIHGPEPGLNLNIQTTGQFTSFGVSPRLIYVLGFQYDISDKFYFNIESGAGVSVQFNIRNQNQAETFVVNTAFSTANIALSAVYRF